MLLLGGGLALIGAIAAVVLVREREIERAPIDAGGTAAVAATA